MSDKEKNPTTGGSYIRHPQTGDLHPNLDDHVMAAQDKEASAKAAPKIAEPAPAKQASKNGGDQ